MSKVWAAIVAVFGVLLGGFLFEREKRLDGEAKLENADTKKNDAVLAQHTADVQEQMVKDKADTEAKKQDNSDKTLVDFLNKK